jgi:SIR2-like protein/SLOG family protein
VDIDVAVQQFAAAIERHAATVLIGAGLSRGAGYPDWMHLLAPFFAEFDINADDFDDLPLLAQYVVNRDASRERLIGHVVDEINRVNPIPTENHRLVVELPIDEIWTTNYDPTIETADETLSVVELDVDFVRPDIAKRRLHKMHGSIRPGEDMPVGGVDGIVLTRDDYDRYEGEHPRAWQLLRAQFLTKSFLFIGFSMTDPNFDAVFKLVRTATPDRFMDHYALLGRGDLTQPLFESKCADLERSGVHVVEINNYAEITELLRALIVRTRPVRLYVSGSYPESGGDGTTLDEDGKYPTGTEDTRLVGIARLLGTKLAAHGVRVAAGSELSAEVGYAIADASGVSYDADQAWVLRRRKDEPTSPPCMRKGTIKFIGSDPGELRDEAFSHIRGLAVLGGGEGTRREIAIARSKEMGIVPLAITGGTAHQTWEAMVADLGSHTLGGRPIAPEVFVTLNHSDPDCATDAAVSLILQAMFLTSDVGTDGL